MLVNAGRARAGCLRCEENSEVGGCCDYSISALS